MFDFVEEETVCSLKMMRLVSDDVIYNFILFVECNTQHCTVWSKDNLKAPDAMHRINSNVFKEI